MWLLPLLVGVIPLVAAQETQSQDTTTTQGTGTGTASIGPGSIILLHGTTATASVDATGEPPVPTGSYITYSTTMTISNSSNAIYTTTAVGNMTLNSTASNNTASTTTNPITRLVGGSGATGNSSSTSSAASTSTPVINTQPCNGYPEFCSRSYSNITMVAAHNSPFVRPGNAASNQALDVTTQLDDGIRMLQFQTHLVNGTLYLCHTTCDLLNAGTLESYLTKVAEWMRDNPYDVVTLLMGNFNQVAPTHFEAPVENSGLKNYLYTPPKIPMSLHDWPSLSSMILSGKRLVVFMDYKANQTEVPWLMDEFSQMWETPFSPTDRDFPCTVQRPPGLKRKDAEDRMYLANHNLNLEVNLGSFHILIPNIARLDQTNAESGFGSLGRMAENCTQKWDRPPNFLLVDYYNYGNPNGSVFEVAAQMNNVTYDFNCCGKKSAASIVTSGLNGLSLLLTLVGIHCLATLF